MMGGSVNCKKNITFNATEGNKMKRNSFLDIIKGICIMFVITTHYTWTKTQREDMLFYFWIGMAVPIFMIITGYVYTKSYRKNEITGLAQAYYPGNLVPRLLRFAVPFVMAYAVEILLKYIYEPKKFDFWRMVARAYKGGPGYGSYYIPVMFQFVFVFPLIYWIVKKKGFVGLLICGGVNVVYELMSNFEWFEKSTYRLLVFRFILVIAYGCYVAFYEEAKMKIGWAIASFILGVAYLCSLMYGEYKIEIFPYWKHVNMLACLYIIPIMGILIRKGRGRFFVLEILGKASFNIFLFQKIYYHSFAKRYVYHYVDGFYQRLAANIILCCIVGVIFYYIECPITTKLIRMIRRKKEKQTA